MKNVVKPLDKNVLIPLGLTSAASGTHTAIHKKMFGSGTTTLIISNKIMNDIMKIIESGLLIKRVRKTIKNDTQYQKGGFFSLLFGTLCANLLENY